MTDPLREKAHVAQALRYISDEATRYLASLDTRRLRLRRDTRYGGTVAFRPAIVNWRTTEADVDLIVEVVRELAQREAQGLLSSAV